MVGANFLRFCNSDNCREQNINFVENIFDGKLQLWIDPKTSNTVDQLNPNLDICGVYNKCQTNADCGRIEKTSRKEIQALMGGAQIILATPPTFELV